MKTTETAAIEFYQNLGKLFYAVAAADKVVKEVELEKLKELVEHKWMTVDDSKNAIRQIISVFNWLNTDGEYNSETCFKEFTLFKNKHEILFTNQIKHLILETANAIAASFSRINKSELILLAKLHLELKK